MQEIERLNKEDSRREPDTRQESGWYADEASRRIIATGVSLGLVLLGLGAVVWALGNIDLKIHLRRKS